MKTKLTLNDAGQWQIVVMEADGTERPPTPDEQAQIEQELRATQDVMRAQWQEIQATVLDPGFRPEITSRFADYAQWLEGLAPHYWPTMADKMFLVLERVREAYAKPSQTGQPDTKPDKSLPQDPLILELCMRLAKVPKDQRRKGWQTEVANKLAGEREDIAGDVENLLRQARRYRHLWETGQ